ncbi:sensor histidine kinase [Acidithrix ferrooxidans]|uniref:Oxygen sensor histidine kinase NreB n=1 Tax=Acidithrix ferrooxidans TaxID=1280514 RepID=A0A0D8HFA4_9ACTN|nr:sensor histidine kinase [Acidithrix ferrooxidans]KJF15741.1 oxygen sensor histidine kinase NreB [Acidithrix ferrooxidans]
MHWAKSPADVELVLDDLKYVANIIAPHIETAALLYRLIAPESQLERFAAVTIDSTEQERKRIANDIHDGVGQLLHSTHYRLDAAMYASDMPESQTEIEAAKQLVIAAIAETKNTIHRLRPGVLDDLGLIAALNSLASSIRTPTVDVNLPEDYSVTMASTVETAIYRIVQEALSNIQRHASAQFASLAVHVNADADELIVAISDDGIGFDPDNITRGIGLDGMRERAELVGATLDVTSRRGHGARIVLRVPLGR